MLMCAMAALKLYHNELDDDVTSITKHGRGIHGEDSTPAQRQH
jgi:hypothetical protein